MDNPQLHKAQISILRTIRRAESARYTDLMRPTGMDSDGFKFHLRKIIKLGYVRKTEDGMYLLTPSGKEFANNLDRTSRSVQKQPKLSVMVVASRQDSDSTTRFLLQKRLRNPYWDFWGLVSGPIRWSVSPEEAAANELAKQTGLTASFEVRSFYRKQDYLTPGDNLLEDKQFIIVEAVEVSGELSNEWGGGHNAWLTLEELQTQDKYFVETIEVIDMLQSGTTYQSRKAIYDEGEY